MLPSTSSWWDSCAEPFPGPLTPTPSQRFQSLSVRQEPQTSRTGLAFQYDQVGRHTGGICFLAKATLAPKIL